MKLFLDTEFNGWGGDLISMALVPAMGEPFYCVLDVSAMPVVPWVRDNVLPVLFTGACAEDAVAVKTSTFQSRLAAFLRRAEFRGGVEIIADWPDDIKYFCAALITGPGVCLSTPPLRFTIATGLPKVESAHPHNALADARALRRAYIGAAPTKQNAPGGEARRV